MDQEVDAVLNIVEARLQSIRQVDEVSGEEGEVLLRQSMQMCQWIVALECFLNGSAADTLLESLVAITRAIADQAEQSQRRRRYCNHGKPDFVLC